jgi:PhnB protein
MATINPYLNFNGKTEEAFNLYKKIFGGEFVTLQRMKDTPMAKDFQANEQNKVMHVALPIGKNILMGSDILESMGHKLTNGNNYSISVNAKSKEEAHSIFNQLAEGGTVTSPMKVEFWGALFGMVKDKFGIHWMVSFDEKQPG